MYIYCNPLLIDLVPILGPDDKNLALLAFVSALSPANNNDLNFAGRDPAGLDKS